jgi:hypothetical protein
MFTDLSVEYGAFIFRAEELFISVDAIFIAIVVRISNLRKFVVYTLRLILLHQSNKLRYIYHLSHLNLYIYIYI